MMDFLSRHKKAFMGFTIILCVALIFITIYLKGNFTFAENVLGYVVTPIQKVTTTGSNFIHHKFDSLTNIKNLDAENKLLKEQLATLQEQVSKYQIYEVENKNLHALLNIHKKFENYPEVSAKIIAKDAGNWYNAFIIDKGTKDAVTSNMIMVAGGGLVGRITESGSGFSKAISIIDDRSSVSAKSLRTGDIGIIRGDYTLMNDGLCRMDYIDSSAQIIEGDAIITSNLSDLYPPDIMIGYVKEIKPDSNGLTKYAIIEPTVDFKHLEDLIVISRTLDKPAEALNHETSENGLK